ncbi:unnamed protein product [Moneuplotes crassus]|uniref:Uncharacterized protein n=1 Tax=Euplotes crassus TaxID=5936 RepID=A0AAD1UN05_EUPCR|nr:unnamed protein product [Moneuplotes crassus]
MLGNSLNPTSHEKELKARLKHQAKEIISNANLSLNQTRLLHSKIQAMIENFKSNKVAKLKRIYVKRGKRRFEPRKIKTSPHLQNNNVDSTFQMSSGRNIFTPEASTRLFSPQPWRLFSPTSQATRAATKNTRRTNKFHTNNMEIKHCKNFISNENTQKDLIYFPFLPNSNKGNAKFIATKQESSGYESKEGTIHLENSQEMIPESPIKPEVIFESSKRLKQKDSRVSLRYDLHSDHIDIGHIENTKAQDKVNQIINKIKSKRTTIKNASTINHATFEKLKFENKSQSRDDDDFSIGKSEVEKKQKENRRSVLNTLLTDKEVEQYQENITRALKLKNKR